MKLRGIRKIAFVLGAVLLFSSVPPARTIQASEFTRNEAQASFDEVLLETVNDVISRIDRDSGDPDGGMIMPMATHISQIQTSLRISADGTVSMVVIVYTYNKNRILVEVTLQRKVLFWWSDVVTFTHVGSDYLVTQSVVKINQSGTYRIKAKVTNNGETLTAYSPEQKWQ